MGILRSLLAAIGGALAVFGVLSAEQVANWTNIIITAAGALMPVVVAIWSAIHHTTAQNPNVKTVP
jgi:hypothetical protein